VRAIANLESLRKRCGQDDSETELVDVVEEPPRALQDGILVTPTLVRFAPLPEVWIIGDLSDGNRVAQALGWTETSCEE
jgi:circadian clock protein KaiB